MEQNRIDLFQGMKADGDYTKSYSDFISQYFSSSQGTDDLWGKLINNGDYTRPKPDFYKKYACDLQYAKDAGLCGTAATSGTSGTRGTTGTSGTAGTHGGGGGGRIPSELGNADGVKKFQDWLDEKHAGWAWGYTDGKVSKGRGYGSFGPRTRKAWDSYKTEYLGGGGGTSQGISLDDRNQIDPSTNDF